MRTTNGRSFSFCRIARGSPLAASLPLDHQVDALGQLLDLLEDVRGDEHGAALGGEAADHFAQVEPLHRVGARERLVEQEQRRVVDERRREAHALPHPAGVAGHRRGPARRRGRRSRSPAPAAARGSATLLEPRAQLDELPAGEEVVDRLVLRHVADAAVDRLVPAHRLAEDARRALGRRDQAGDRAQQRRLAGAVRPEQRRHARPDLERDVADATTPPNHRERRSSRDRRFAGARSTAHHPLGPAQEPHREHDRQAREPERRDPARARTRRRSRRRRSSAPCRRGERRTSASESTSRERARRSCRGRCRRRRRR